ncbi:MAG: MFS transporter [Candidatus Bathyarchaeia archaeon]
MGVVLSLINLASAAVRLPAGFLSDRYGYKRFLFLGLILCSISLVMTVLASTWQHLIIAMVLAGLSTGFFYPTQNSIITRYTSPAYRATAFSIVFVSMGVGGVIGPAIGGFIYEAVEPRVPFVLALVMVLSGVLFAFKAGMTRRESDLGSSWTVRKLSLTIRRNKKPVALFSLARLTSAASFSAAPSLLSIYLKEAHYASETHIGLILAAASVAGVIGTWMSGMLSNRLGSRRLLVIGLLAEVPGYVCVAFVSDLTKAALLMVVLYFVGGAYWIAFDVITGDLSTPDIIGLMFGLTGTFLRFVMMLGNILGGVVAELYGPTTIFYLSAAFSAVTLPLILTLPKGSLKVGES